MGNEGQSGNSRGEVTLTVDIIDRLKNLLASLSEAATPPPVPPKGERDEALWRKAKADAERELLEAAQDRAKQLTISPSGRRRSRKLSGREALKVRNQFNRRVREIAEDRYRALDPTLAATAAKKEADARSIGVTLSALMKKYWPAIRDISLGQTAPKEMWEDWYEPALQASDTCNDCRDVVIGDLDQVRLVLEREEKRSKADAIRHAADNRRKDVAQRERPLLISALLKHHRFETDELNFEPLTQKELMQHYGWSQSKASRVARRNLPGGWAAYRRSCKGVLLEGYLKKLDDDSMTIEVSNEDNE